MLRSSVPPPFNIAFASSAGGGFIRAIPQSSQIGVINGAASLTDGFPPLCFQPVAAGGIPPFGEDFNGILRQLSLWSQWQEAGAPVVYDPTFATAIGGYPGGAILASAITPGVQYYTTTDNNLTNPDDPLSSANWARIGLPAGTPVPLLTTAPPPGFILANSTTVGSAASNANNPSGQYLFVFNAIWTEFSNAVCPIFDSSGNPTTRGANPVADFNANKRLTIPGMRGLGIIGCDTMGGSVTTFLAGVPVTVGNTTTPGSVIGENLHQLSVPELPAIIPAGTITNGAITSGPSGASFIPTGSGNAISNSSPGGAFGTTGGITSTQATSTFAGTPFGSNSPHNTVERNMTVFWGLKT